MHLNRPAAAMCSRGCKESIARARVTPLRIALRFWDPIKRHCRSASSVHHRAQITIWYGPYWSNAVGEWTPFLPTLANGDTSITKRGELITRLPAAAPNSHWTKNLLAHPNGEALFVAVGSNSNIGELGVEAETGRAGIWRLDLNTRELTPFAKGLRNPVGMAWHTSTDTLWTVVNERDQLGNDLVPDYLAQVNAGDDFGWPTHYWGNFRTQEYRATGSAR